MEGKIDGEGDLLMRRGAKLKGQECFYSTASDLEVFVRCGDWCPQFGEPMVGDDKMIWLTICQKRTLFFDRFTDERD